MDRWGTVQRIFEGALALEGAPRDAYLDAECAGDAALRAEVVSLLAADARDSTLLDGLGADAFRDLDHDLASGTAVGAWRVTRRIGEGGMGMVYLAERADGAFEQRVALKVIKQGMDSHEIVARFRAERRILARLQHPGIARLLDGGVTKDGRPWFAMEYVDGQPIDAYCDRHRLTVEERLDLFGRVCVAVQFAHANLVVHRDLKPDNILVTEDGEVKLLDFGIGKVLAGDQDRSLLTQAGTRLLTPAYASPEQLQGESVSTATDVFSLGMVLFELLVGQRPLRERGEPVPAPPGTGTAENLLAALQRSRRGEGEARLDAICNTRDTRAERLERQLRGDLEVICGRALQVEPARRYASVEELAGDLRRHRTGQPVLARPDSVGYRTWKFVSRNRVPVFATVAVVTIVAATVGFYTAKLRTARARAEVEATKSKEVATFMVDLFRRASPQSTERLLTARQLLDAAVAGIDTLANDQPELYSDLLMSTGMVYREMGDLKAAEPQLRKLVKLNRTIFQRPAVLSIQAKSQLATTLEEKGQFSEAEGYFESALAEARGLPEDPYAVAYCLNNLAKVRVDMARYAEAEAPLREAVAIYARRRHDYDLGWQGTALRNLARAVRLEGRWQEADSIFALSLAASRAFWPKGNPALAGTLYEAAALAADRGVLDSAAALARDALEMRQYEFPDGHATIGRSLVQLARIARLQGNGPAASQAWARGHAMLLAKLPSGHPWIAQADLEHAEELRAAGRPAKAELAYRVSLDELTAALGKDHPDRAAALLRYGSLVAERRGCHAAAPMLDEGMAILIGRFGADNPRVRRARESLTCPVGAVGPPSQGT